MLHPDYLQDYPFVSYDYSMMLKSKTACEGKVVNLELKSRKKQSKNEMKIYILKSSTVVDAGILFQVVWRPHFSRTARSSKPANLAIFVIVANESECKCLVDVTSNIL